MTVRQVYVRGHGGQEPHMLPPAHGLPIELVSVGQFGCTMSGRVADAIIYDHWNIARIQQGIRNEDLIYWTHTDRDAWYDRRVLRYTRPALEITPYDSLRYNLVLQADARLGGNCGVCYWDADRGELQWLKVLRDREEMLLAEILKLLASALGDNDQVQLFWTACLAAEYWQGTRKAVSFNPTNDKSLDAQPSTEREMRMQIADDRTSPALPPGFTHAVESLIGEFLKLAKGGVGNAAYDPRAVQRIAHETMPSAIRGLAMDAPPPGPAKVPPPASTPAPTPAPPPPITGGGLIDVSLTVMGQIFDLKVALPDNSTPHHLWGFQVTYAQETTPIILVLIQNPENWRIGISAPSHTFKFGNNDSDSLTIKEVGVSLKKGNPPETFKFGS
jgi:hypothetical protein